jgi:hypothetical protein
MSVSRWVDKFLNRGLFPFEKNTLDRLMKSCTLESASQIGRQIQAINKIQRIAAGKEVNLYCMRWGKPFFDDELRFHGHSGESLLATAQFINDSKRELTVKIWLVSGRLFSITYSLPPTEYFKRSDLREVDASPAKFTLWFDPNSDASRSIGAATRGAQEHSCIDELAASGILVDTRPPKSAGAIDAWFARFGTTAPQELRALLLASNGLELTVGRIYGLEEIYESVFPSETYLVIGEKNGVGAFCIAEGVQVGAINIARFEQGSVVPLESSLCAELLRPVR